MLLFDYVPFSLLQHSLETPYSCSLEWHLDFGAAAALNELFIPAFALLNIPRFQSLYP